MKSKHAKGGDANVYWVLETSHLPSGLKFVPDNRDNQHYLLTVTEQTVRLAKKIILKGRVDGKSEAKALSEFYWNMVDVAVGDEGHGVPVLEAEGVSRH